MRRFTFHATDESETAALGAALARVLPDGAVVALCGTLGAGKTRLVQAIAAASGVAPGVVVSPTFVLLHEYQGDRPIFHFDAYRLKDEDEFLELGPEEYFERAGLTLIEWADRVENCLPEQRVDVTIEIESASSRRLTVTAIGDLYAPVVDQLQAWATKRC